MPCGEKKKKKKSFVVIYLGFLGWHPSSQNFSFTSFAPEKSNLQKSQEKKTKTNMIFTSPCVLAVVMQSNFVVHKIYIMHLFKKMVHK